VKVPTARLEVVSVAAPLDRVALASVPFWSLKVTVPPLGVAPPAVKSLTFAVNVTGWPGPAAAVEAISAVRVGRPLNTVRCSSQPTQGWNLTRDRSLSGRRVRQPRRQGVWSAAVATDWRGRTMLGASAQWTADGSAQHATGFDKGSVDRRRVDVVMVNALQTALLRPHSAIPVAAIEVWEKAQVQ
jgi:hypothetical protein